MTIAVNSLDIEAAWNRFGNCDPVVSLPTETVHENSGVETAALMFGVFDAECRLATNFDRVWFSS